MIYRFSQDMQLIDGNLQGSSINTIEGTEFYPRELPVPGILIGRY